MSDVTANQQTADQKVAELSEKVDAVVTGVSGIRADLDALKNAHNDPDDKTTLSAAGLAALDGALAKVDALADSFAAPSVPTEPEAPIDNGGTSEPTTGTDAGTSTSTEPTDPSAPTDPVSA